MNRRSKMELMPRRKASCIEIGNQSIELRIVANTAKRDLTTVEMSRTLP
jgi:hypothetical protein